MIKILKYTILALMVLNLPSTALNYVHPVVGSLLSYLSFALIILYYLLIGKTKLNVWMIAIGLIYFMLSGLQIFKGNSNDYIVILLKYLVVVGMGYEVIKRTTKEDLFILLTIGASSIFMQAFFFPDDYGRYSGFFINPNAAGFICSSTYALSFGIKNKKLKLIGQGIALLCGLLTFSRTFILIIILISMLSLVISIKNIRVFGVGFLILLLLVVVGEFLKIENPRYLLLKQYVTGTTVSTTQYNVSEDSRAETWARFYEHIYQKPFFGNGFGAFQKGGFWVHGGAHNTFLLIFGEAGVIPFLMIVGMYISFFYKSIMNFRAHPNLLMQTFALVLFLMAAHNYFILYYILFISMWIQYNLTPKKLNNSQD